jgi:two-component system chemotaxis response regulator CheB
MSQIVRVLVVDDSAYVRKVVTQMLGRSPFIEVVGAARDGREALEMTADLNPDVVTCDLNMPEMDGVTFVREQMARRPVSILIISIAAGAGEQVLAALDAGAVDFVQKPTALATERLMDMAEELVDKVKAAATVPRRAIRQVVAEPIAAARIPSRGSYDIVVIGVSTGGPQALKQIIPVLPAEFPVPVAMVLHMPIGYTEMYALKLNEQSALTVVEAGEGQVVEAGTVFLAPAGRHLSLRRDGAAHAPGRPSARHAASSVRRRALPIGG